MTVAFELPDLGEGVAEGEVLAWHVEVGERVEEDDVMADVETDKAAVEVPSPVAGTIAELHAEVGEMVQTGSVLVTIEEDGEAESAGSGEAEGAGSGEAESSAEADAGDEEPATADDDGLEHTFAPPVVRRIARELGVDIEAVEGSGPAGRVTEGDVRAAAEGADGAAEGADEAAEGGEPSESAGGVKSAVRRVDDDADEAVPDEQAVESTVGRVGDEAGRREGDAASAGRDRMLATPATRKLARELDVDLDAVPTDVTRDGEPFVDEAAVRAFAADAGRAEPATPPTEPSDAAATSAPEAPGDRREDYRGIRRRIGEQMGQGWSEVPHATHHDRVEVSELVEARERLAPLAADRGVDLTYTPLVVKCVAAALEEHPIVNTHFDAEAEEIVFKDSIDVGVATATDRGLLVPVLADADERGLIELAADLAELVAAARDGSIDRESMQGATFTVTNVGAIGGEYANPIVNVPQTAILATGALKERPVAIEGEVVARPTLPLSLALDHRVIDGADAARFVNTLKTYLQDPTRLLLG